MTASADLIQLINKKDPKALKQLFDEAYPKFSAIAMRYAKNAAQAEQLLHQGLMHCFTSAQHHRHLRAVDFDAYLESEFILSCIQSIKDIRNEYYVSSTVHATENQTGVYNLFDNQEWTDLNQVSTDVLILSLQQLVPSQRLVFNLHVVDGKSLNDAANFLESSIETVKSNLEKARYHLQKNIEKNLKK
ncbi:MAG: sigma-70 family RNA polymerase sigma factor [Bacteroidota bacterium]